MNVVVVALQNIEPPRKPLVGYAEDREIMKVLDLVVDVELIEHELQTRHELARKFLRRKPASAEKRGDLLDRAGQLAKHGMARKPETRHFTEIRMGVPLLARKARDQEAQVLGPAAAARESKGVQIGGNGDFDGHRRLAGP